MNKTQLLCSIAILLCCTNACNSDDPPEPMTKQTTPVANAGDDQTVQLPQDKQVKLDGTRSYDPDAAGRVMSYQWKQVAGAPVSIPGSDLAIGLAVVHEPGTYSFELTVKDVQSLVDRDTVIITAVWGLSCAPEFSRANAVLSGYVSLEQVPTDVCIGMAGGNLVLAGGRTEQDDGWGGVDVFDSTLIVYNLASQAIIKKELSAARARIGIVSAGDQVFLAGGINSNGVSDAVDIFNLNDRTLRKEKLSVPRSSIAAVSAGHLLFFAGGNDKNNVGTDVVDIYDQNSRTWSVAKLSLARANISAVTAGAKVFFAGGDFNHGVSSSRVDIYDLNTGQWSTSELPVARTMISSAVVGNEIAFVSGIDFFNGKRFDQADYLNSGSLSLKTSCVVGMGSYSGEFGQNIRTVLNNGSLFYLSNGMILSSRPGEQSWKYSYYPDNVDLISLVSDNGQLYGVQRFSFSFGALMDLGVVKISF